MSLLRAAFEQDNSVVSIVVLCVGCFQELTAKLPSEHKRWSRPLDCGCCEFCMDEVTRTATTGN